MGTVTPGYSWPIPGLTDVADGPDGFDKALRAVETTVKDTTITTYIPAWTSIGTVQPSNAVNLTGRFSVRNGWCQFQLYCSFGASTVGGRGGLIFSLPVPAAVGPTDAGAGDISTRAYIPGRGNFMGYGVITADRLNIQPFFPMNETDNRLLPWQSADSTGAVGTGVPLITGSLTVLSIGYCIVAGRYIVA